MGTKTQWAKPMRDMGVLERNKKIEGHHSPDFVGEIVIDDVPYRVACWDDPKDRRSFTVQRMGDWS